MFILSVMGKSNTLVFFHGWDQRIAGLIASRRPLRRLFLASFGRAGRLIVLAREFRVQLVAFGVPEEKVSVLTAMFDGRPLRKVVRRAEDGVITILSLSRLVREKGVYELLGAFERLAMEDARVRLIIAGEGPERAEIERLVRSSAVSDRIRLPGYVRDEVKAQVLVDADIFVLPSYGEGCPISMLEAMGAGLAVVVPPVGGIADLISDERHGVLLPEVSVAAVYQGLRRLIADPVFLARSRVINREQAWARYEASVVTRRVEDCYYEIAGRADSA